MILRDYKCVKAHCGVVKEVFQQYSDTSLQYCPNCGSEMKKIISSASFSLKGEGWYKSGFSPK